MSKESFVIIENPGQGLVVLNLDQVRRVEVTNSGELTLNFSESDRHFSQGPIAAYLLERFIERAVYATGKPIGEISKD